MQCLGCSESSSSSLSLSPQYVSMTAFYVSLCMCVCVFFSIVSTKELCALLTNRQITINLSLLSTSFICIQYLVF